ncbi:phenylhydantoinase, partial [mine drainage metagenome]
SENNARAHGMFPRKGCLVPGADADLVVFSRQPEAVRVTAERVGSFADYTPYEGRELHYLPTRVFLRGRETFDGESFTGAGTGEFLHRPLALPATPGR